MSARLRLTVLFGLVLVGVAAAVVVAVVLVMTFVPDYRITAMPLPGGVRDPTASALPAAGASPDRSPPPGIALQRDTTGIAGDAVTIAGEGDLLRVLLMTSGFVLVLAALAGVAVSWHVAGRVLRPVAALTEAARRAEHGRGARVPETGPDDEFRRAASTFNAMLDRLDASFAAQQRFAANASHELRTPLATTQAMLDVALADPASVNVPELAARLRATNARSVATVDALLALADARSGPQVDDPVSLRRAVGTAIRSSRIEIERQDLTVHLSVESAERFRGDPVLVDLLVDNLVRNAVRHNVSGGFVTVTARRSVLTVENSGPAVSEEQVERLVEPFHRAAGRVAGSHGLGLAIVQAVADVHDARLELRPRPGGGLVVRVTFDETMEQ